MRLDLHYQSQGGESPLFKKVGRVFQYEPKEPTLILVTDVGVRKEDRNIVSRILLVADLEVSKDNRKIIVLLVTDLGVSKEDRKIVDRALLVPDLEISKEDRKMVNLLFILFTDLG